MRFIKKNGYLFLILLLGVILMLLPGSRGNTAETASVVTESEERLSSMLSRMEGVGEAYVLLSEKTGREGGYTGAVVVCSGAGQASVRLRVIQAVSVFTGLSSDRIIVQRTRS